MRYAITGLMAALIALGLWIGFFRGLPGEAERVESVARIRKVRSESAAKSTVRDTTRAKPGDSLSSEAGKQTLNEVRTRLLDRTPGEAGSELQLGRMVSQLPLEVLRELLAHPGWFEEVHSRRDVFGGFNPVYPHRHALTVLIWERFGELAPQEALDLAFKGQGWKEDTHRSGPVLHGIAKVDPALALKFLKNQPEGIHLEMGLYGERVNELFTLLARHSALEAFAAIPQIPQESRGRAYAGYASTLGPGADWHREIGLLARQLPEMAEFGFDERRGALVHLAAAWTPHDPDAAFAWMAASDEDPLRAYLASIGPWVRADPDRALAWLKTWQPEGMDRDQIYSILLSQSAGGTAEVDGLMGLIRDPGLRDGAVIRKLEAVGYKMPPEELRHLQASPLLSDRTRAAVTVVLAGREEE